MKKSALLSALSVSLCFYISPLAFSQETYVRKPLPAPDFFVPQKDVQYQEKLPPFPQPELPNEQIEQALPEQPKFQPVPPQTKPVTHELEFNPSLDVNLGENQSSAENTPKYKQEYDAYLQDLNSIALTGKAPNNPELNKDLSALSNDTRINVNNSGMFEPQSFNKYDNTSFTLVQNMPDRQPALVSSDAKIIDTVEVLNIPKSLKKQKNSVDSSNVVPPSTEYKNNTDEVTNVSSKNDEQNVDENLNNSAQNVVIDSITSPEVAAYFRGTNPFIASGPSYQSEEEHKVLEVKDEISEPLPDIQNNSENEQSFEESNEVENTITEVLPLNTPPKISKSKSSSKSSSHSSGKSSFGLGPNMVR